MINTNFWVNKRVFITGHTGFKGSWLSLWLHSMGAKVYGYAQIPNTEPSLYHVCGIDEILEKSFIADIRDSKSLQEAMEFSSPEIVIHMAAQPLVRESYINPVDTYSINVMGTVNLFEAVRNCSSVKAVVNVTTDKCYENKEWVWGYRENEPMGGYDPYSSSKACSELVTSAYKNSFFYHNEKRFVGVASARAGNVIGGGDWAKDRLIPDCIKALMADQTIIIRNPYSIRPWQHVLEPLGGYLLLAEKLFEDGEKYSEAWNFGPYDIDAKPVEWIVQEMCNKWGTEANYRVDSNPQPHEAQYLKLDCSKANAILNWSPRWNLETAIEKIVSWTKAYRNNENMREVCIKHIKEYQS
ncbi:CDP-glucose 4,6-dehydratase [Paenibacillus guangzhouensis]|uniref:CDP-glucose 4,6-dehydratase n=1 Tax=Paenibacillus guangzhouensis TaxID=1473112 RepID=UPI0012672D19|nr:CDP-glucose 4,6-dehydratase [Paenibacillus guangzhouensis]